MSFSISYYCNMSPPVSASPRSKRPGLSRTDYSVPPIAYKAGWRIAAFRATMLSVMRAEELIVNVFRQKSQLTRGGRHANMVVMSRENYDAIEDYRRKLPPYPPGVPDYLTQHTIFGLPIFIDNECECEVRIGSIPGGES